MNREKKKSFKINGFFQRPKKYVNSFGFFSKECLASEKKMW